jgi:hypothetical protein
MWKAGGTAGKNRALLPDEVVGAERGEGGVMIARTHDTVSSGFMTHDGYWARNPPSTFSEVPVMNEAASLARNSTALAISSARPMRPTGCSALM